MKTILVLFLIVISINSLSAQNQFYGRYDNLLYNQQKEILKKFGVKKLIIRGFDKSLSFADGHISDEFVEFDEYGNTQTIIKQDSHIKETFTYRYLEFNTLEEVKWKTQNRKSRRYAGPLARSYSYYPKRIYYEYDDSGRLVKKASYSKINGLHKTEHIRYSGNKVFTAYEDKDGNLEKTKIQKSKDSVEVELIVNKFNEIEQKSEILYNRDSLKLQEKRFQKDDLTYLETNKIENNNIVRSIKIHYYKSQDTNDIAQYSLGENYIYNSDLSLKSIVYLDRNDNTWIYEYGYDDRGLLIDVKISINGKFKYSNLFEYTIKREREKF